MINTFVDHLQPVIGRFKNLTPCNWFTGWTFDTLLFMHFLNIWFLVIGTLVRHLARRDKYIGKNLNLFFTILDLNQNISKQSILKVCTASNPCLIWWPLSPENS